MNPVDAWHELVADPNSARLRELLSDDVVFRSPAVHAPQVGAERTHAYLWAALQVLGPSLTYVEEWRSANSAVLHFTAEIDALQVEGVDILHFEEDKITSFTVAVRPLKGLQALVEAMGTQLARVVVSTARTVFVSGGTSGINLAIATAFAERGDRVAVLSRSSERVDAALAHLRAAGAKEVLGFPADVREASAVTDALARTAARWGPIDIVVSGAAGNFVAPAKELSSNGFRTVVDIDLLGTFNVLRGAFEHLRKPGASLVNITAAQSWLPTPGQVHVSAAKAGIDQITRTLAIEWGPDGVRVNSVAPGPVRDTEGMRRLAPNPAAERAWTRAVPLRRFAEAEDIVAAVEWLTSPGAAYVTGVVLSVDGGLSLGGSSAISAAMSATGE